MQHDFLSQNCQWSRPTTPFFSVQLEWCAHCWNQCILVLIQKLCWLSEGKSTFLQEPAGHYFCISYASEVCFFLTFFFSLEFIIIHLKLQIMFLRPFDNFENLLVSNCHKSFHCGCEILLHYEIFGIKPYEQWNFLIASIEA